MIFRGFRALPHIILFQRSCAKAVIGQDIERWLECTDQSQQLDCPKWKSLIRILHKYPAFRNLFYCRIGDRQRPWNKFLLELAKLLYKPIESLVIYAPSIGPGLFIQHGFSTIVFANKIGGNCWINQQVTVGYSNRTDCPTIGNNVRIYSGAKVIGNVTIGDNSIVGANAVVIKNVPPNCTVVGVPAYIVKQNGKRITEPLTSGVPH